MNLDLVHSILVQIIVAAAIYGGIRADLGWLKESTRSAHRRLDDHMREHHNK